MILHRGDYVFYYWKGAVPGPRLVKITLNSSNYIVGIPVITTSKSLIRTNILLDNTNIDSLQYIPSNELHLHPHLSI